MKSEESMYSIEELKHIVDSANNTIGITGLDEYQTREMHRNYENMINCMKLIINDFGTYQSLESQRYRYSGIYKVLKLLSVSSINLMDFEGPSLTPLTVEGVLEIRQNNNKFDIF